jgi:pyrroloquinoline quinone biosynthesis protein B
MKIFQALIVLIFIGSCNPSQNDVIDASKNTGVELIVLGTIQDAGSPHIACTKECCAHLFESPDRDRMVVSLGVMDHSNKKTYLFDATPDVVLQLKKLKNSAGLESELPNGIFLTHAHIGHYTGLMHLGKEALDADSVPVYAMPKMKSYLEENGPWGQLVSSKNIKLLALQNNEATVLNDSLKVTPLLVPHRDEYSETVGFLISGPTKTALFIPDIDKWHKWGLSIIDLLKEVDYAFLDATFYDGNEIPHRDMSEIPHPFVVESMDLFKNLSPSNKAKIHFIHLNHTNPLLNDGSTKFYEFRKTDFNLAKVGSRFEL